MLKEAIKKDNRTTILHIAKMYVQAKGGDIIRPRAIARTKQKTIGQHSIEPDHIVLQLDNQPNSEEHIIGKTAAQLGALSPDWNFYNKF